MVSASLGWPSSRRAFCGTLSRRVEGFPCSAWLPAWPWDQEGETKGGGKEREEM